MLPLCGAESVRVHPFRVTDHGSACAGSERMKVSHRIVRPEAVLEDCVFTHLGALEKRLEAIRSDQGRLR